MLNPVVALMQLLHHISNLKIQHDILLPCKTIDNLSFFKWKAR